MRIIDKLKKLLPGRQDNEETRFFKIIIYIILGIILLMVIISVLIFFLNIEEREKTKVPNLVTDEYNQVDITDAMVKLQEKGLNVKIQLKHSSIYARGIVIDQNPKPGANTRVGRYITLTISQGPVFNKVDDYTGQNIDDVRLALQAAFSSGTKAILQIDDPLEYDYSQSVPVDHIIEQLPLPGTDLVENKITYLKLTVSLGPEEEKKKIDNYLGLDFRTALERLYKAGFFFIMKQETGANTFKPGAVTFQEPLPGEETLPGVAVQIRFNKPVELEEGQVFGWFRTVIREYDVPVPVELTVKNGAGTSTLFTSKLKGGEINIPYILPENSELTLYVLHESVEKQIVIKPAAENIPGETE